MGHEPGDSRVSDETRAFEQQDEQVEPGPDREPEPGEEAAAERAGPVEEHARPGLPRDGRARRVPEG